MKFYVVREGGTIYGVIGFRNKIEMMNALTKCIAEHNVAEQVRYNATLEELWANIEAKSPVWTIDPDIIDMDEEVDNREITIELVAMYVYEHSGNQENASA